MKIKTLTEKATLYICLQDLIEAFIEARDSDSYNNEAREILEQITIDLMRLQDKASGAI